MENKFAFCATKKNKYSNSRVIRKKFLNEKKNHTPPNLVTIKNISLT